MTSDTCTIRRARPEDAPAAAAMWAEMAERHKGFDEQAWPWAADAPRRWQDSFAGLLDREDMLLLVAERDGQAVGFVVVQIKPRSPVYEAGEEGFVWDLGVRGDCRRQGIGRRLMQAALAELKRRGVGDVILHVAAANEPAARLYESLGMRVIMHRMYKKL